MPLSTAQGGHATESNETSGGEHVCPSCGGNGVGGGASRKNSTASNKSSKSVGGPRVSNRKETAKRGRDNGTRRQTGLQAAASCNAHGCALRTGGDDESDSDAPKKSDSNDREEDPEVQEEAKSKSQDEDDGGDSSDAATSAARPTRSLRPRRKAASASASQAK